jgi:hypothetical protein
MAVAASSVLAAHGASPAADELAHCAAITAPDARLACYDALSHRNADASSATARVPVTAPQSPQSPQSPQVSLTAPASPPPSAAAAEDPKNFGLSPAQQHVASVGIKSEEAQIVGITPGEPGHATIVLDNGQSWNVLDDDGWLSNGSKVTIKRAALGSFMMRTPSHHTYRVRRIE